MLAPFGLAASLLFAPLPQDQAPAAPARPSVTWQRTLADALAAQKATGLPLLIAVNMDGEVFNDRFAGETYHDPAFIESTRGYVCVVASPDRHTERDYDALGNRIECPRFGGCTCSEHIAIEPELFQRWFNGQRNAPRHVGVSPDGKILFDRFLDQSMQTAIDAVAAQRGRPRPDQLAATGDLAELFRRRDSVARLLLEQRYRSGDAKARRALLEAAAKASNEPLDLLRMGIREEDGELCGLAALALAKIGSPDALIDIEDALARLTEPDIRQALLQQLQQLGKTDGNAARLASYFEKPVQIELPAPWRNDWTAGIGGIDRAAAERALDAAEAAIKRSPDSGAARLQLATAQAAFATVLAAEGGQGVELWFTDAERNAGMIRDEALQPEAKAVLAIAAWYTGDGAAAAKAAIEAMAAGKSDRRPDGWLAQNFLDVLLQITAQTAYGRVAADAAASLRGELNRVHGVFDLLAARNCGSERGELAGIGLLEFAGLRAEAQTRLAALARRHPGSVAVHDRWRNRLLVDLGAELMRHAYAKFVTDTPDPAGRATAQWFAGYAALVAGDRHTQDGRRIEADNAYGDAVERLLDSAALNEDYADTAKHYAVLALAGRAAIRQARGNGKGAVADLVRAAELRPASLDETDGIGRKPRSIADRIARELRAAGQNELADQLQPILP